MGVITELVGKIDVGVATYGERVFTQFAGELPLVLQTGGAVGIAIIGLNMVLQTYPLSMAAGVAYMARLGVVTALATSWANFAFIYNLLTDLPLRAGAEFLNAAGAGSESSLYESMDGIVDQATAFATMASETSSMFAPSLVGVIVGLLAALMACAAVLIISLGKIGLAVCVALAPLALLASLYKTTHRLFAAWSAATIGFAMIPLVTAAVMGAVVGVAASIADEAENASTIGGALPMIVVMMSAIFMMMRVPQLVQQLSGAVVATGTGIAEAVQARNMVLSGSRTLFGRIETATSRANAAEARAHRLPVPPPLTPEQEMAIWKRPPKPPAPQK